MSESLGVRGLKEGEGILEMGVMGEGGGLGSTVTSEPEEDGEGEEEEVSGDGRWRTGYSWLGLLVATLMLVVVEVCWEGVLVSGVVVLGVLVVGVGAA